MLICQGVYYFMCLYICVCTMLRVLICQGVYYFMSLYICVDYVKSVNISRSLLFHVFILCVYYVKSFNMSRSLLFHVFIYSSSQNKVSVPLLKRRKKFGVHLNKRRSCLSILLAYFRRTLNVPYRACSQYSLRVSIFKRDTTPPTNKLSSLFTSQLACDSVELP